MACSNCGYQGHNARTCRRRKKRSSNRKCGKCGMPGHDRRNCPGRFHPCCSSPRQEYHSSWADETGLCASCGKRFRWGNGPLAKGAWPR